LSCSLKLSFYRSLDESKVGRRMQENQVFSSAHIN
jgi:hypothetical protein